MDGGFFLCVLLASGSAIGGGQIIVRSWILRLEFDCGFQRLDGLGKLLR